MRDALSIFDRMVAFSGKNVTYDEVISNLNVLDYDYYFKIVDAVLLEDISQVMLVFDDILRKGFDPDIFINGLAEHLRNLLVCKDPETINLLEAGRNLRERYAQQARITPNTVILTALNIANDCDINYKMARNKRLHVEMALIKMTFIQRAVSADALAPLADPEKKTPELSRSAKPAKIKAEKTVELPKVEAVEPESAPESAMPAPIPEERTTEKETPPPAQKPKLSASPKLAVTPQLKGLDALAAEVQAGEEEQLPKEALTPEALEKYWDQYVEEECDQDSVRTILKAAKLTVENSHHILVTVGSVLAENTLRQERLLMDYLRGQFKDNALTMGIEVDRKLAPEMPKRQRPLTPKEKFLKMRKQNPALGELQKRFDLRPDED